MVKQYNLTTLIRGVENHYLRTRFVTQEEFRELKLKEIGIE